MLLDMMVTISLFHTGALFHMCTPYWPPFVSAVAGCGGLKTAVVLSCCLMPRDLSDCLTRPWLISGFLRFNCAQLSPCWGWLFLGLTELLCSFFMSPLVSTQVDSSITTDFFYNIENNIFSWKLQSLLICIRLMPGWQLSGVPKLKVQQLPTLLPLLNYSYLFVTLCFLPLTSSQHIPFEVKSWELWIPWLTTSITTCLTVKRRLSLLPREYCCLLYHEGNAPV